MRFLPLVVTLCSVTAIAAPKDEISKPLKTVVQSVRYGKDALALKHFAGEEQGKRLLGDDWAKASATERQEFIKLFQALFSRT